MLYKLGKEKIYYISNKIIKEPILQGSPMLMYIILESLVMLTSVKSERGRKKNRVSRYFTELSVMIDTQEAAVIK